ncbi:MAG TPA: hypothetical protein VH477_03630 [Bryobacteraceae bacterium]|jgi:hypothetical protein
MTKINFLLAAGLLAAPAVFADYPRDAAERFKLKYGINHPVVEQEAREARKAKAEAPQTRQEKRDANEASLGSKESSENNPEPCSRPCK